VNELIDVIPDLQTCIIVLGFGLGYLIGNAGYSFDGEVKYGFGKKWFNKQNAFVRYLVGFILDVFHHWQYGLVSIIIGYKYLSGDAQLLAWYFGWGFIVSDMKDFENILIRLGLKEKPSIPDPSPSPDTPASTVQVGHYTLSAPLTLTPEPAGTGINSSPESPG